MKTKHLLTAMALPLLFAACSQDEFESISSNPVVDGRKTVGTVTINFDEAATRMNFVGGATPYQWVAGDQFGACLMDEAAVSDLYADDVTFWGRFKLVDYIHTNYPFTRQESGVWTSEAVMSEGNYFFYYPYNYNMGGRRSPIKLEIPTQQVLTDGAKPSSLLKEQLFVGYAPVVAQEGKIKENVSVNLEPLLAFPGFRLENTGNKTVNVHKIAFAADHVDFPTYYEVKPANFNNSGFAGMNATNRRNAILAIAKEGQDVRANQIALTFGNDGKTLKTGETCLGYILLPPMTTTFPKLYIYTDLGLGVVDLSEPHVDAGSGAKNITNDRALKTIAYNDGAIVNITFDDTALDQPLNLTVRSTDELEDLVYWSRNNTSAALTATLANDDVVLSQSVCDMLKANDKISLHINGASHTLNIPAGISNDVLLQQISFENAKLAVADGANIQVPSLGTSVSEIVNEGTINLTGNNHYFAGTITNKATVNITGKNAHVAEVVNDGGFLNVNAAGVVNIATLKNQLGTVTVAAGKELYVYSAFENSFKNNQNGSYNCGYVVVNGTLSFPTSATSVNRNFINKGIIDVAAGGTLTGNLVNDDDQIYTSPSYNGYKFSPTINNSGIVSNVKNCGLIVVTTSDARTTTHAESNGYIDNTILNPYVYKNAEEKIRVVVGDKTASEVAKIVKASNANLLQIYGTLTVDAERDANGQLADVTITGEQDELKVEAIGDLTIAGEGKVYFSNAEYFWIREYTTTIIKTGTTLSVTTGKYIYVDGKLLIQAGATLIAGPGSGSNNVENYGTWTKQ